MGDKLPKWQIYTPTSDYGIYDDQSGEYYARRWRTAKNEYWEWDDYAEKDEDDRLCAKHPGLAELRKELNEAQEKYDAMKALVQEEIC